MYVDARVRRLVLPAAVLLTTACAKGHGGGAAAATGDAAADAGGMAVAPHVALPASGEPGASASVPIVAVPAPPPPSSQTYPPFRRTTVAIEDLTKLVSAAPELARVGGEVSYFDPGDGSYIVRSTADRQGVSFTTQPLLWSPEPGQQVLVVAARGKTASFVAAWWVLPDGGYRLASSLVMLGEITPIALAWRPGERATLWWTSCWQCPGETGHVSVKEDGHLVIVQD